ncbi:MAG: hypothetical protein ACE5EA_00470 [Nitrospirota bacterium]
MWKQKLNIFLYLSSKMLSHLEMAKRLSIIYLPNYIFLKARIAVG